LQTFALIYNIQRPHRAIGRRTPAQAYTARPKAHPTITIGDHACRTRHDVVDTTGAITPRSAGKLRHLGVGSAHNHTPARAQAHGHHTMVINRHTGEIIAEHHTDPATNYQKKLNPPPEP